MILNDHRVRNPWWKIPKKNSSLRVIVEPSIKKKTHFKDFTVLKHCEGA